MIELLSSPWPWYVGGPLLGLTVPFLLFFTGKQLGISISFKVVCSALIGRKLPFFDYDWKRDLWRLLFAAGVALGGFVGTVVLKNPEPPVIAQSTIQDLQALGIHDFSQIEPAELFSNANYDSIGVILFLLIGGLLIGFGSRYADGCTSGHAIMGISYFQFASLVATAGFFIGGLFMTHILFPIILKAVLR